MKNNTLPLILLVGFGMMLYFSWSNILNFNKDTEQTYSKYIEDAQFFESREIYVDAITQYEAALKLKPEDHDTAVKLVSLYDKMGNNSGYLTACDRAVAADAKDYDTYLLKIDRLMTMGEQSKAFSAMKSLQTQLAADADAPKEFVAKLDGMILSMQSAYTLHSCPVSEFYGFVRLNSAEIGQAKVRLGQRYGIMNATGQLAFKCEYDDINITNGTLTAMKDEQGKYRFYDNDGNLRVVTDKPAEYLGVFIDGYASAKIDGVYGYINQTMQSFHFEYEYAGNFGGGVAPVKKDGKWAIINETFQPVTQFEFDEILVDNYGFGTQFGVFFAKKNGVLGLYNNTGLLIADGFEDVKLFASDQPAAVKKDGKWGFIQKDGTMFIEPYYADADSFSVSLAPVVQPGQEKWGVIDTQNRELIPPTFDEMQSFNGAGYSYVVADGVQQFVSMNSY